MDNSDKLNNSWKFCKNNFSLDVIYLNENKKNTKYSLSGEKSIFNSQYLNEENKDDLLSLFKFADKNKDQNLSHQEIANAIYEIIDNSRIGEELDIERLNKFLKSKKIKLNSIMSILDFVNIGNDTSDGTVKLQNGEFTFNNQTHYMEVKKYSNKSKNRTYILSNPSDGTSYIATFGGQNPNTQQMVSEFYAKAFNNDKLLSTPVTAIQDDYIKGVINPDIEISQLDKNKKLGLDIFFSNDEIFDYISYAGTLDQTSRNLNTVFSIIPTEFESLTKNKNFSRDDLIQALEAVVAISDNDIKEITEKYNNSDRYEDILLKRKNYMANMLELIKITNLEENQTLDDYIQNINVLTIESTINSITNEADLNSYSTALKYIADKTLHDKLRNTIENRLNAIKINNTETKALAPYTMEQLKDLIENYGFDNIKKNISALLKVEDVDYVYYRVWPPEDDDYCLEIFNELRNAGIDVTKDVESVAKYILFASIILNNLDIDIVQSYNYITEALSRLMPNDEERNSIDFYKSESYSQIHNGTDNLINNDVEPTSYIKDKIEVLNNYLHKCKTEHEITTYRGERAELFNNIIMPNDKTLGESLNNISEKLLTLDYDEEIPNETMEEINNLVDYVNNNNFDVKNTRFCSMTLEKNTADYFHEVTLKIKLPAGSSACFIDLFSPKYISETEVLASYGAKEKITGAYFDEENRWIIFKVTLQTHVDINE